MRYVVRNFNAMISSVTRKTEGDLKTINAILAQCDEDDTEIEERLQKAKDMLVTLRTEVSSRVQTEQQ